MEYKLKMICSWCGKDLGTKPCEYEPKPGLDTSHYLCPACVPRANAEVDEAIRKLKEKKS